MIERYNETNNIHVRTQNTIMCGKFIRNKQI